ncbi:MAG: hypothetical protein K2N56_10890 [Oscillospiraceae bacterium]|nr:hypothetical protein [Oscillospiraceae bacterium]
MAEKEYIINDNVIIPEYIKKMTREERDREIARIEKEHLDQKRQAQNTHEAG